ncbi:allergen Bos d 2-like [Budorcas taxicolor]|uniref:allergen Bos d 2-like n=1 Tax=Budorcas taxicolor TaxID=37181 RepID=UPI002284C4B7|nr:allergen Bos d 2-like [Budorcas taxicolor]
MKAVFLTLLLGLVCAAQEAPAQPESSEITANWCTIYMAADHKEKIEEGGPLRTYFCQFECIDNCEKMSITFILTNYYSCTLITVVAQREEGNVYHVDYMGKNSVQLIPASESMLVFYAENFDGEKTTKVTYALGKGDSLSQEDIQKYEEINNERGIPNENREDGSNTGDWRSILTAADNKEKIEEEGPLRAYVRQLECIDSCSSLSIKFYAK